MEQAHTRRASRTQLTRVLAADGRLVADGLHVSPAVAASIGKVEVYREPVHARSHPVVVVELAPFQ